MPIGYRIDAWPANFTRDALAFVGIRPISSLASLASPENLVVLVIETERVEVCQGRMALGHSLYEAQRFVKLITTGPPSSMGFASNVPSRILCIL